MAKILISAGEASGDVHAAAVTKALKRIDPSCEVFGMGGDCLREAGGEVLFDIKGDYVNITVSKKIKPITPGLSYIINKVFDVEVTRVVKNEQT